MEPIGYWRMLGQKGQSLIVSGLVPRIMKIRFIASYSAASLSGYSPKRKNSFIMVIIAIFILLFSLAIYPNRL